MSQRILAAGIGLLVSLLVAGLHLYAQQGADQEIGQPGVVAADDGGDEESAPTTPQPGLVETLTNLMAKADAGSTLAVEEHEQLVAALKALLGSPDITNAKAIGYVQWAQRVLTAEGKGDLRTKLLDRLAGMQGRAAALTPAEAYEGMIAFDQLAGAAEKMKMIAAWVGAGDGWKSAKPAHVIRVLHAVNAAKPEDVAELKTAVVDHIWKTYLAPQADAAAATGPEYAELAIQTHRLLSGDQQKELATAIVPRLADPATAAQLSMEDIRKARATLGTLRNPLDIADIMAAWVNGCDKYKQASPADLGYLCDYMRPKADLGGPQTAIAKIIRHARSAKLFSDTETIARLDSAEWIVMARALRYFMLESDRLAVSAQLKILFVEERQRTQAFTPQQLNQLVSALREFGLYRQVREALPVWLSANDWSALKADQLAALASCFELAGISAADGNKAQLAAALWRDYFDNNEFMAQTALPDLAALVRNAGSALSAQQQAAVASKLVDRFAADAAKLAKLSVADAIALAEALRAVKSPAPAAQVVVGWIGACEAWKQAGDYDQQILAGILKDGDDNARQKAVDWALRVYDKKLVANKPTEQPETVTLAQLASFMRQMGLTGRGKGYPGYAAALGAALKAGAKADFSAQCATLALPLGTPETRQTLQALLVDEAALVRQEVARVLAWAYRHDDALGEWQAVLDAKLGEEGITGDTKAAWLMARAFAADPGLYDLLPQKARPYLTQALSAAKAEAMKLVVLRELVNASIAEKRFDEGLALVSDLAGQFEAEESKAELQTVAARLAQERLASYRREIRLCDESIERHEQIAREHQAAGKDALRNVFLSGAEYTRQRKAELVQKLAELGE